MLFISLLVAIVIVSFAAHNASALFFEQKGDFDWAWRSVGFVQDSYDLPDGNILTFSQDKVFSLLDQASGKRLWRVILPENEAILDYGADSENLYVASIISGLSEVIKVTNYKIKNGFLGWDAAVKRDSSVHFNATSHPAFSDLKIDHPSHVVWMISNRVVLINKNTGLVSYQVLPQAIKHASGVTGGGSVVLAKLVSNTFADKIEFMGCISDRSDNYIWDDKCSHLITATYEIKSHDLTVKNFVLGEHLDILGTKWLYNGNYVVAVNSVTGGDNKVQNVLAFETLGSSGSNISPSVTSLSNSHGGIIKSFELFSMNNNRNHAKYTGITRCYEDNTCKIDILTRGQNTITNKVFNSCKNIFVSRRAVSPNVALSVACIGKDTSEPIKVIAVTDASSLESISTEHSKSLASFAHPKDFGELRHFRCSNVNAKSNCIWQFNSGLLKLGVELTSKWQSEEGLVNIRNIEFPREVAASKLGVDLSFSNRLELQKSALQKTLKYLPSMVDNIKGLFGDAVVSDETAKKRSKEEHPFFSNNFAVILAGENTRSIRLASIDAFSGESHWVSALPFEFNHESIKNSELVVLPSEGRNKIVAATIIVKTASSQDYIGYATLDKSKIIKFSGFSRVDHSISEVVSGGDSQLLSLGKDSKSNVVLNSLSAGNKGKPLQLGSETKYFHLIDADAGEMKIFATSENGLLHETANVQFAPSEKIVARAYIDASAKIYMESIVAGDDTVLTKYLNPNMVGIVTVDSSCTENYAQGPHYLDDDSVIFPTMTFYLIDTVSGKFIHRISIKNGAAPVHMVLIENNAVVTYWNWKAKRTELLSVAYFDGRLDKYVLNPLASQSNQDISDLYKRANFTSFKTSYPLAMHKIFILPNSVISIGKTKTHKGITNKQVLLAFSTGQLYSLGLREINPRRPLKDPTNFEMQEGLMKYTPFIYAHGLNFVTLDDKLEFIQDNNVLIAVKSTLLESSAIVVSHWGGLDTHGNVVTPSQGFDSLTSDFNYSLLLTFVSGLSAAVYVLKGMVNKRKLKQLWA